MRIVQGKYGPGEKFSRMTLLGYPFTFSRGTYRLGVFRCECGTIKVTAIVNVTSGRQKSCGCWKSEVSYKHGGKHESLYKVWRAMKQRCCNPKSSSYEYYGGRGIAVCEEWENDYAAFRLWAMTNGYEKGKQVDRKDNDKGYSSANCRIADRFVNMSNTRKNIWVEAFGERKTISQWIRDSRCGVKKGDTIKERMSRGMSAEQAITGVAR